MREMPIMEHRSVGAGARAWVSALFGVLLVCAMEQVIEHSARQRDLEQERYSVLNQLSTLRARLEGVIDSNLFLVNGLTAVISARPDIDQAGFSAIARGLVDERHGLRHIAGAPDLVVSLIHPTDGNEAALGLDYRTHPKQREPALRARDSGHPVVAGPLSLQQGGVSIIVWDPVFKVPAQPGGRRGFWGLVLTVIDAETLYRRAGLRDPGRDLRVALRGRDGTGPQGPVFFGEEEVFSEQPVTQEVTLPGGTWQLAATPAHGWGQQGAGIHLIRLMGLLAAVATGFLGYRLTRGTQALARSSTRLRALLNTIPDLVWLTDRGGVYLACNPRVEQLYGAGERDILGKTDRDLMPAELAGIFREQDQAVIDAGRPCIREDWMRFAGDGPRIRAEIIKAPVHDAAGRLLGVLGIARDVTQRRRIEAALQESETRLRLFIEHAPAALAMFDRDMRYLAVSSRWLSDYGLRDLDLLGRSHYELFPEIPDRWKVAHGRGLTGEVVTAEEEPFNRRDGTLQWLRWEIRPWHTPEGGVGGIVIFTEDVTERKLAEIALREQEEFFRMIAENIGDMVAVLDCDGRRLYNSPSFGPLFGSPEAMKGTDHFTDIHPDDRDRAREAFREILRTGQPQRIGFRFVLRDGSVRAIESQRSAIRGADGRVERVVIVGRDVTERKRMDDEIRRLNAELEERVLQRTAELAAANKELEAFTYSVSHDLKAPLRGIDGYSRLLQEDYQAKLDDEGRLFLTNIRRGTEQMSQLIEDLLAYSRMERRKLHSQSLDLSQAVAKVLAERQPEMETRGTVVDTVLPDGLTARADADGLNMVLRNLVDNALKFSRDSRPPTLSIHGSANKDSVVLDVKDNGIGFDMQFHDRIFEMFQRLQRAEDYPGTGIGLAIVRKAVERMGGRIRAESAPGLGATFHLELPR